MEKTGYTINRLHLRLSELTSTLTIILGKVVKNGHFLDHFYNWKKKFAGQDVVGLRLLWNIED